MRKILLSVSALLAFAAIPLLVSAGDTKTLTGEPVDIKCYLAGQSGPGHAACATGCAKKGLPIGLLTTEGDKKVLYLVMGADAAAKVSDHMGKQVEMTGKVSEKDGLKVIEVTECKVKA